MSKEKNSFFNARIVGHAYAKAKQNSQPKYTSHYI